MNCVICLTELVSSNDSLEHIIPASVGGKLKKRGVLCRACNNTAGEDWDSDLARQLNFFSVTFDVVRERGPAPPEKVQTSNGGELLLHPGKPMTQVSPVFKSTQLPGCIAYEIQARSMDEAKAMVKKLARRHPDLDVEAVLASAQISNDLLDGYIHVSTDFAGVLAGRSIVKSALCWAALQGVPATVCHEAREYLTNTAAEPCFGFINEPDPVLNRPIGVPLHCVAVSSVGAAGQLLGYVEFFGWRRIVIQLARDYRGPTVHASHFIDPRTSEVLELDVDLRFDHATVASIFDYKHCLPDQVIASAEPIIETMLERLSKQETDRASAEMVERAFRECGASEGEMLTEEHLRKLAESMAEQIVQYQAKLSKR
ncbi:HNH endonuclease [Variovorax sp. W6]|uniref:HNH endonuclease n=1 Tax=Variovorax sp. W6 TaxID=3093895 RepID=UPI003D804B47